MNRAITTTYNHNSIVPSQKPRKTFLLLANVYETGNEYLIVVDIPGASEDSVEISIENNVLHLRASVKPIVNDGFEPVYCEYDDGDYRRTFTLSEEVDADNIKASVKHGVLRVTLPKSERAKPRKITVKCE